VNSIPNKEQVLSTHVLATFDIPAFMKRAKRVERVYEELMLAVSRQRDKQLVPVRDALAEVVRWAGSFAAAAAQLLQPESLDVLVAEVRLPVGPEGASASVWRIRRALDGLADLVARFNVLWAAHLGTIDLVEINTLRDGYNRYYVIEKECVVHSREIALAGFTPLPPLKVADLEVAFPLLPVPQLN
jgi:hypothetical protein